jgi:flavin reductase (DIM6/NTAB) family NADH-FMN oxidoreductase RutF
MALALNETTARACYPVERGERRGQFIEAAARLAGAVAIVAGQDDAEPFGLVVSALAVLSVEPARVLFCVRKAAGCYPRLLAAETLSLAVLRAEDEAEAVAFAAKHGLAPRFAPGRWRLDAARPPRFDGALVSLEGEVFQRISAASHAIFILDVEDSRHEEAEPLLYFNRDYRRLATLPRSSP